MSLAFSHWKLVAALGGALVLGGLGTLALHAGTPEEPFAGGFDDAPGMPACGFGHGMLAAMLHDHIAQLGLTGTQKDEIRAAVATHRAALRADGDAAFAARREIRDLVHADTLDEAQLRDACQKAAAADEALTLERAHMMSSIRGILDAKQRAQADEMRQRFESHLDQWRQDMPSRVDRFLSTL